MERKKIDRERRRISAIECAERDGQVVKKWRLRAAGYPYVGELVCRPCDPLRMEEKGGVQDQKVQMQQSYATKGMDNEENGNHDISNGNDSSDAENEVERGDADVEANAKPCDANEAENGNHNLDRTDDQNDEIGNENEPSSPLQAAMERRKVQQQTESPHNDEDKKVEFISSSSGHNE